MSTKTQAIWEDIQSLPREELRELCGRVLRLLPEPEHPPSTAEPVSEEEFDAALAELTGCSAQGGLLQRLLEERGRDREREEVWLEARKRKRARG